MAAVARRKHLSTLFIAALSVLAAVAVTIASQAEQTKEIPPPADVSQENRAVDSARLNSQDNTNPPRLPDLWEAEEQDAGRGARESTNLEKDNEQGVWLGSAPGAMAERGDDRTNESNIDDEQDPEQVSLRAACSDSNSSNAA